MVTFDACMVCGAAAKSHDEYSAWTSVRVFVDLESVTGFLRVCGRCAPKMRRELHRNLREMFPAAKWVDDCRLAGK